jgi:hypothetical protein
MEVADTVRKAVPEDLPEVSSALSRAFFDDPLMARAIPDEDRRQRAEDAAWQPPSDRPLCNCGEYCDHRCASPAPCAGLRFSRARARRSVRSDRGRSRCR